MSLYTDEHGYEKITPVSGTMVEVVGGALDAYYQRIRYMERDLEHSESQISRLKGELDKSNREAEEAKRELDGKSKAMSIVKRDIDNLTEQLGQLDLDIAKRDAVIEQYAAWRVAVREAISDSKDFDNPFDDAVQVVARIEELTKELPNDE